MNSHLHHGRGTVLVLVEGTGNASHRIQGEAALQKESGVTLKTPLEAKRKAQGRRGGASAGTTADLDCARSDGTAAAGSARGGVGTGAGEAPLSQGRPLLAAPRNGPATCPREDTRDGRQGCRSQTAASGRQTPGLNDGHLHPPQLHDLRHVPEPSGPQSAAL